MSGDGAPRVLWVTNDLPPRAGGIQQFVHNLLVRTWPEHTLVVGPDDDGDREFDREQPYDVVRAPGSVQPTPAIRRLVTRVGRRHRPDVVVLGASWPLGEIAGGVGRDLDAPVVALSHGLEAGLAGARLGRLVRHATRDLAVLTTISDYAERELASHVEATRLERVPPGVDVTTFHPDVDGSGFRRRHGVPRDARVVVCVSRLVRRKGQDRLLEAWPVVLARCPDAWLVVVGGGPIEGHLRDQAARLGPHAQVVLTGEVPWDDLPAAYAAGDVFAMPCRTRLFGTDVEGLGIVFLEASATGRPVVAGDSGGAPETVLDGETGTVVDGRRPAAIADALVRWLDDPEGRAAAGRRGRAWVEQEWSWDAIAARFRRVLCEVTGRVAA